MKKILYTSFQTWDENQKTNSAQTLLTSIMGLHHNIFPMPAMPVDTDEATETVRNLIEKIAPTAIVLSGMTESRSDAQTLFLERFARNDNDEHIETKVDVKTAVQQIPALAESIDAGEFICERMYYNVMPIAHNLNIPVVFVHVPYLSNRRNEIFKRAMAQFLEFLGAERIADVDATIEDIPAITPAPTLPVPSAPIAPDMTASVEKALKSAEAAQKLVSQTFSQPFSGFPMIEKLISRITENPQTTIVGAISMFVAAVSGLGIIPAAWVLVLNTSLGLLNAYFSQKDLIALLGMGGNLITQIAVAANVVLPSWFVALLNAAVGFLQHDQTPQTPSNTLTIPEAAQ